MPVELFYEKYPQTGGYPLHAGDMLTIRATYENSSGRTLRKGAMGIVVGYFVPRDEAALAKLRHEPRSRTNAMSQDPAER